MKTQGIKKCDFCNIRTPYDRLENFPTGTTLCLVCGRDNNKTSKSYGELMMVPSSPISDEVVAKIVKKNTKEIIYVVTYTNSVGKVREQPFSNKKDSNAIALAKIFAKQSNGKITKKVVWR